MIINTCLSYTILLSLIFYVNDKKTLKQTDSSSKNQTKNYPVLCLVIQSRPTLCDPMDCSPPGSSVHGDSPGKNTGVGFYALLQGIFPTQELNPGLLHCRWILLPFEPPRKPKNTGVGSLSLLQGICPTQESNWGHCIPSGFFTS